MPKFSGSEYFLKYWQPPETVEDTVEKYEYIQVKNSAMEKIANTNENTKFRL